MAAGSSRRNAAIPEYYLIANMTRSELHTLIKSAVAEAVNEALTVEVTVERVRDERTGLPLAVTERKTEKVFIPSLIVQMLPFQEGAMRGFQQDLSRTKNALDKANGFIRRLAEAFENQQQQYIKHNPVNTIDYDDAGNG